MGTRNREKENKANRERRAWYKENGICVECGQKKAFYKRVRCEDCLYKLSLYKEPTDESRKYKREWVKKRIEAGLCINCSRPVYHGSKRYCEICHSRIKAKDRERKRKKAELNRDEKKEEANKEIWSKNLEIARQSPKWLEYIKCKKINMYVTTFTVTDARYVGAIT